MKTSMRRIVADNYEELSRAGADEVVESVAARPVAAILAATGNTPMGLYQELARRRGNGTFDASKARVFQLDEYVGLEHDDRRSLYGWTRRAFVDPLGIPIDQLTRLSSETDDLEAACRAYEAAIESAGGIDLAILGLGPNGHLGFNEPPADSNSPTRVVNLTIESVDSNAEYWGGRDEVPRRAMTAGMDIILAAKSILLVVSGAHKRDILERTVSGAVTPDVPASYLQLATNVTILADRDAWGH